MHLLESLAPVWGLKAANKEQRFALDLLLDDDIKVIVLDGPAGTGKTLCAVAAGLHMVVEQHRFERMSVYRPVIAVGHADLGYLPGTLDEKIDPWMAAITDAVAALSGDGAAGRRRPDGGRGKIAQDSLDYIKAQGLLTMESVTHLRGRTLHSSFVLVDEAMNLSPQVGKTLLTRIGADSKIVLDGGYVADRCAVLVGTNQCADRGCVGLRGPVVFRPHQVDARGALARRGAGRSADVVAS